MKKNIDFNTYKELSDKIEILLGEITSAEKVEKSDKMLKLTVNFGNEDVRTVMTNIGNRIDCNELVNSVYPFITNLEPAKIMGIMSSAMIMVPSSGDTLDLMGNPGSRLM
jgi:methionyl-tRNA synthetase